MQTRSAIDLLELWEHAGSCEGWRRGLRLLEWALPGSDPDVLADMDLGQRDWHLTRLLQSLFGPRVDARGQCVHCGAEIEVGFDLRDVQEEGPLPDAPGFRDSAGRHFRLPCSRDLLAISRFDDADAAELTLLQRCAYEDSAGADLAEVNEGLSELAATRQLRLLLDCEACGGRWTLVFDPAGFLWEELDARARQVLDDVHRLAGAYGWSESQILALTDARRAAYLERVA